MNRHRETPPRWLEFTLWFVFITLCLAPLPWFIRRLLTHTLPSNAGLFEVVFGLLGLFLLWRVGRRGVLWLRAGPSVVETSDARIGEALNYRLRLGCNGSATLFCRERRFRRETVVRASFPLAPAVQDPASQRWTLEGALTLPEDLPGSKPRDLPSIDWEIDVKMTFPGGAVLEETHPLRVDPPR